MFTTPQRNQECFRNELSVQSLTFLIISTFWLDTETKQRSPLMLSKNFLSFSPTATCTAAQKRNTLKNRDNDNWDIKALQELNKQMLNVKEVKGGKIPSSLTS